MKIEQTAKFYIDVRDRNTYMNIKVEIDYPLEKIEKRAPLVILEGEQPIFLQDDMDHTIKQALNYIADKMIVKLFLQKREDENKQLEKEGSGLRINHQGEYESTEEPKYRIFGKGTL